MWKKLRDEPPRGGLEIMIRNGEKELPFKATVLADDGSNNHGYIFRSGNTLDHKIAEWMELPE